MTDTTSTARRIARLFAAWHAALLSDADRADRADRIRSIIIRAQQRMAAR